MLETKVEFSPGKAILVLIFSIFFLFAEIPIWFLIFIWAIFYVSESINIVILFLEKTK